MMIALFILIALIISTPSFFLFYNRHVRDYQNEIELFLKENSMIFSKKINPQLTDWKRRPFEKPSAISFSVGHVSIGGFWMNLSNNKYYIIQTISNTNVWLEINTTLFFKPYLTFKKEHVTPLPKTIDELKNKNTYECPACNYINYETDENCSDCGLKLR